MEEVKRASYDVTQKHRNVVSSSSYSLRLAWGVGALSWGKGMVRGQFWSSKATKERTEGKGVDLGVEGNRISTHTLCHPMPGSQFSPDAEALP